MAKRRSAARCLAAGLLVAAGSLASAMASVAGANASIVRETTDGAVTFQMDATPTRDATAVYPAVIGATDLPRGIDGSGVTVAVIDTGVAAVPDLAGRLVGGVDLSGENDPFHDSYGHGTFVAGLIAGNGTSSKGAYRGVAPKTNIVSVKIAGADGSADVSQVLAALQWVVSFKDQFHIRVVNLSLGTDSTQKYQRSLLNYAVERAWDAGIVVVVSAGNLGPASGTVTKPGDDPLVITAGAVDDAGTVGRSDDSMPGFSGVGPTVDGFDKPDLVAPGRSVISLRAPGSTIDTQFPTGRVGDAYFKGSGTSFAAAVTSGAAADLLDAQPQLTPDQVKSRFMRTAVPSPSATPNVTGAGSLDVRGAVAATGPDTSQAGIPRALGSGALAADRGSYIVTVTPRSGWTTLLGSDQTSQNQLLDRTAVFGPWTGSSWYGSSWYGSSWYGSSWYGSSWYGSSWYGSSWYGSSWYGSSWYGSSWYAVAWA
jgi:serine protease AprX